MRSARSFAVAALAALAITCVNSPMGPSGDGRMVSTVSFVPSFSTTASEARALYSAAGLAYDRVRVIVSLPPADTAVLEDTTFALSAADQNLAVTLSVSVSPGTTADLELEYLSGQFVLYDGKGSVTAEPVGGSSTGATPVIRINAVGPGAKAATIAMASAGGTYPVTSAIPLTATATDSVGGAIASPILVWSVDDTTVASIGATSGVLTPTGKRGTATVTVTTLSQASQTAAFVLVPPAASMVVTAGANQSGAFGTVLATPVGIQVRASDTLGVGGQQVVFTATQGALVKPATVSTDASGTAQTTVTVGNATGPFQVTATLGTLSAVANETAVPPGPAAKLALTVSTPASVVAGAALGLSPTVQVADADGNPVAMAGVSVAASSVPSGIGGTTTVATDATGKAVFSNLSFTSVGRYTISFSAASLIGVSGSTVGVGPAAASVLAFTNLPATMTAGGVVIRPAVQVSARDAFGNAEPSFTGNVTMSLSTNPTGAAFTGSLTVAAVDGVATFSNLSVSLAGSGYVMTAVASGLSSVTSSPFAITSSKATIVWTNAAGGLWSTPSNWSLGRAPQPGDSVVISANGTYTVTIDTTFSGASITLGGGTGTQTLLLSGRTLTLAYALTVEGGGQLSLEGSGQISPTVASAGSVVNAGIITAANASIAAPVANEGTIVARRYTSWSGAVTTTSSSLIQVIGDGSIGAGSATFASGLTNTGEIDLTSVIGSQASELTVTGGPLVNSAGATINGLTGAGGGRTLYATLNNQGTITAAEPIVFNLSGASTNSGTIDGTGADLTVDQAGSSPTFVNTGVISSAAGHTLAFMRGAFVEASTATLSNGTGAVSMINLVATLNAGFRAGAVTMVNDTVTIASGVIILTPTWTVGLSTINGPGTWSTMQGQSIDLSDATINMPFDNFANVTVSDGTKFSSYISETGSLLQVVGDVTFASGFTNTGTLQLTNALNGSSANLTITSGVLTNAAAGTISVLAGTGGTRTINAPISNAGTIDLFVGAGGMLNVTGAFTSSGTINLSFGDPNVGAFSNGRIVVTSGNITLSGTLDVTAYGGYVPVRQQQLGLFSTNGSISTGILTVNTPAPASTSFTDTQFTVIFK